MTTHYNITPWGIAAVQAHRERGKRVDEKDVFVRVNRAVTCIQRRRRHRRSEAKRSRIVETAEYLISDRMMAEEEEEGKE